MPRLRLLLATLLLGTSIAATPVCAQTGRVEGRATDAETGEPLPGVNLTLEGTAFGAATDAEGTFAIEDVPPGAYTLVASFIGYATQRLPLDVRAGETTRRDVAFAEDDVLLQDVEVIGRRATTYDADVSFAATRTATPIAKTPQSISVVTKEVIDDQQLFTLDETTRNVSGVSTFSGYNDLVTRGFRNQNVRLVNGLRTEFGFWTSPMLPHLERVEYVKGPASALFAAANPGGTVNMVTKKPLPVARQALSFTAGSFGTYRGQLPAERADAR